MTQSSGTHLNVLNDVKPFRINLGLTQFGGRVAEHDFNLIPNMVIEGRQGSGKTVLINCIEYQCDIKGVKTIRPYYDVAGVLKEGLLEKLTAEAEYRARVMRSLRKATGKPYTFALFNEVGVAILERIFLIIDDEPTYVGVKPWEKIKQLCEYTKDCIGIHVVCTTEDIEDVPEWFRQVSVHIRNGGEAGEFCFGESFEEFKTYPFNIFPESRFWSDTKTPKTDSGFNLRFGENITIDLNEHHNVFIAGRSGTGKSSLLKTLMRQCALKDAEIYALDLFGMEYSVLWDECATVATCSAGIEEALEQVVSEMSRRFDLFEKLDCGGMDEYNKLCEGEKLSRIVVAWDDMGSTASLDYHRAGLRKSIEEKLLKILEIGSLAGIHVICCAKDIDGISDEILGGFQVRICGATGIHDEDKEYSRRVLNGDAIAWFIWKTLPRGRKGETYNRFYASVEEGEPVAFSGYIFSPSLVLGFGGR